MMWTPRPPAGRRASPRHWRVRERPDRRAGPGPCGPAGVECAAVPARPRRGADPVEQLIALDLDDALTICDKLNRRLGLTRDQWTELAAKSMRTEPREPGDPAEH